MSSSAPKPPAAPAASSARLEEVARRLGSLSPEKQAEFANHLSQRGISVLSLPIVPQARPAHLPLSFAQQRLWLLAQLHPDSAQYNIPRVYSLTGALDRAALEAALGSLLDRHEALRTTYTEHDGAPAQVVQPLLGGPLSLQLTDLSASSDEASARAQAQKLAEREAARPFDLAAGPLVRAQLLRLSPQLHWLLVTSHHIAMDEWSDAVISRELVELYDAHRLRRAPRLPPLPIQYADFSLWQRRWLEGEQLAAQLAHWRAELGDGSHEPALPADFAAPLAPSFAAASHRFQIAPALEARLRVFAARANTTMFTTLLALFQLVLHRMSGNRDIRIGSPIANRHRREVEGLAGCFANTQVLRAQFTPGLTFQQHLEACKRTASAAQSHQDLPFERLVEELAPERDLGQTPLFQVMFSWHRGLADAAPAQGALAIGLEAGEDRFAKFDLVLHMTDDDTRVGGELLYRSELFAPATMADIDERLHRLAAAALDAPDRPMERLAWLTDDEVRRVTRDWNATQTALPASSLHEAISGWAVRTPDAAAVQFEEARLSYRQLDAQAARIAGALAASGIVVEDRVGLCLPRSLEWITGMLGVLKAGAAYVPLDPRTPPERLRALCADLRAVLVRKADIGALRALGASVELIAVEDALASAAEANVAVAPGNAAYVIYTSGSTGNPKGVVISHGAITSYAYGLLHRFALPPAASMALVSTPTADLGNTVLFGALVGGGLLHVVAEDRCFDPDRMSAYLSAHPVDVLKITPSHLGGLLQAAEPAAILPRHTLVLGGEAAAAALLARVRALSACRIANHYGPTETTVGVLTYDGGHGEVTSLPLGQPLPNRQAYILDGALAPVPPGVYGELFIGGDGVGRGYLGRPDATADRFVPDPFGAPGGRLYRTGDRTRYRADGSIEFAGRTDDQIKLRGHRIEPGEIRAALLRLDGVTDAHVMLREGVTAPRLVAYLLGAAGTPASELATSLGAWLPEHMVPADFVWLPRFPLTANGKLDRRALPDPEKPVVEKAAAARAAALSPLEELIADVWKDVLQLEAIGVDDNFFSMGGDSLLAFQVVARLRKAGVTLTIPQLFAHQSVSALAKVAGEAAAASATKPSAAAAAAPAPVSGEVPLTPIQRWFFAKQLANPHHFNQSVLLELPAPLDAARLESALGRLVAHHDGLRLRFRPDAGQPGGWRQAYSSAAGSRLLEQVTLNANAAAAATAAELAAVADNIQQSFDLGEGPLLRAVLFDLGAQRTGRLLIAAHHLVVDGVSWRALLEDLAALYRGEPLPAVTSSYQAWARALVEYAGSDELRREADYWRAQVASDGGVLELPLRPGADERGNTQASQRSVTLTLDEDETAALLSRAPAAYRTRIDELLLTALSLALCEWTGGKSALLHLENHGREALFDGVDVSRTIGWFTATHPLRLTPRAGDLATSIKQIKEQVRAIPHRGVGYGVLRYLGDGAILDEEAAPKAVEPRLTFNYLGQFDQVFDDDAPFKPAAESSGAERDRAAARDRWLDVLGMVESRRLSLEWQYSPALHSAEQISQLAERTLHHLRAVIAHCTAQVGPRGLTPSDVPYAALSQAELDGLVDSPLSPLPALGELQDLLALTPIQEGILFHCLAAPGEGLYITQRTIELSRAVDVDALRAAWQEVAANHDVLRTGFVVEGLARPIQAVWRDTEGAFEVPFEVIDARGVPAAARGEELSRVLRADRARGFDLARPPLMRVTLWQTEAARYQLIWTDHHLLLDGWSSWRVLSEVLTRYQARRAGERLPARRTAAARDYVAWLAGLEHGQAEAFWRNELGDLTAATRLAPQLAPPPSACEAAAEFAREELELSFEASEALRRFAQTRSLTINTLVQGALALVLGAHTGKDDVTFGVTVAGRSANLPGADEMVGLFINTLPLRVRLPARRPIVQWLAELQTQNAALREYEHTPLLRAQSWSGARGALFDLILIFENYPIDRSLSSSAEDFGIGAVAAHERTNYPLALEVSPGERLRLQLDVDLKEVSLAAGRAVIERLAHTLQRIAQAPATLTLAELPLVTDAERRVLAAWNGTAREVPMPDVRGMAARFEAAVDRAPEAIAVSDGARRLSYAELDAAANRLAWRLVETGVGAESLVGIAAPRSLELMVGLLAIWKAGAAYLPLDPEYPADRLAHMIADAAPAVLLVGAAQRQAEWVSGGHSAPVWSLEDALVGGDDGRGRVPRADFSPAHLAYCIYTSGSTGTPKGVAISHANLENFLAAMEARLEFSSSDAFLSLTSLSFDIAALELWLPLTRGGRVVLAEREEAGDAERLLARLASGEVPLVQATPTTWRTIAAPDPDLGQRAKLPASARVLCGGEALPADLAARLLERAERVINVYGPTETTVWSSLHMLTAERPAPLIGRPLDNQTLYILDGQLRPVPPGVTGELYIGGLGLARGYLRRPALTAERFSPDPFSATPGARMYRTGDLARHGVDGATDGSIECLGRTDDQIKLRGHRIELGEIESKLRALPGVAHAVVAARPLVAGGEPQLCAYVVGTALEAELRGAAALSLPEAMRPQRYLFLDELPRTANGKLDRKALPHPAQGEAPRAPHVPPRDERERGLVEIWARLLRREASELSVHDDFFALGGDSLVALQVVAAARSAGLPLTPRHLFEHPTIRQLAEHLARAHEAAAVLAVVPPALAGGRWATLSDEELDAVAESRWLPLAALPEAAALERAMRALEQHHEALRLRVRRQDGQLRAAVGEAARAALSSTFASSDVRLAHDEARHRLRLGAGPLLHATRLQGGLLLTAHALAVDAASWPMLLADLQAALQQQRLPAASDTVEHWLRASAGAGAASDASAATSAAASSAIPRQRSSITASLDAAATARLRAGLAAQPRLQADQLLLAALTRALGASQWIDLESSARRYEPAGVELARLVGGFTAAAALFLQPAAQLEDLLDDTSRQLQRAQPGKQARSSEVMPAIDSSDKPALLVRFLDELPPGSFDAFDALAPHVPHAHVLTAGWRGDRFVISLDDAALLPRLIAELGRLADELSAAAPRAPRPDDFSHVQLDASELADLLEDLS